MLAQIEAANHDFRFEKFFERRADFDAAKIIPIPDNAEINLTENSPQPKILRARAGFT